MSGSKSRSLDVVWNVSVSRKFGKASVSSCTENRRSPSRLCLGPYRLILLTHFQQQKFTKLSTTNRLSVGLYSTACHSHSLFLLHRLVKCKYYQAFVLFSTYLSVR